MLRKVGLVQTPNQSFEVFIFDVLFCFSVGLNLSDFFHRISLDQILNFKPVEEHAQIADIIVDRANTDRLAEVPSPIWMVDFLLLIIAVKGVLPSFLKVIDVPSDDSLAHLVYCFNL